jgi:twitching motility protein PilT
MDYDILDILRYAIEQRASDVHITVKLPPMIRKDTVLMPYGEYQLMPADTEALTMSVLNDHQKDILEKNGEVDFSYIVPGIPLPCQCL